MIMNYTTLGLEIIIPVNGNGMDSVILIFVLVKSRKGKIPIFFPVA